MRNKKNICNLLLKQSKLDELYTTIKENKLNSYLKNNTALLEIAEKEINDIIFDLEDEDQDKIINAVNGVIEAVVRTFATNSKLNIVE